MSRMAAVLLLLALVNVVRATPAPNSEPVVEMTWEAWITVSTCAAVLLGLSLSIIDCAPAMIVSAVFLYLCGIVDFADVLGGLSNSSVATIALLFIVVDPIAELPKVRLGVGKVLGDLSSRTGTRWATFKIVLLCMATSSFLNNTPQVAVLTNIIKMYCRECGASPSQILLPMNFATLCGNYALIGTSSNLIVDGLMQTYGLGKMPFFELLKLNGPFTLVMVVYLVFMPRYLLPLGAGGMFRAIREKSSEYLSRLRVREGSPIVGVTIAQLLDAHQETIMHGVDVLQLQRDDLTMFPVTGEEVLLAGDVVMVRGHIAKIRDADTLLGLEWLALNPASISGPMRGSVDGATSGGREPYGGSEAVVAGGVELIPNGASRDPPGSVFLQSGSFPRVVVDDDEAPAPASAHTPTILVNETTAANVVHQRSVLRAPRNGTIHRPGVSLRRGDSTSLLADDSASSSRPPTPGHLHHRRVLSTSFGAAPLDMSLQEQSVVTRSFAFGAQNAFSAAATTVAADTTTAFFEVVLGPRCPAIGATVASGHFQVHYSASVLAVRAIARLGAVSDMYNHDLAQHILEVGDTALILARVNFKDERQGSGEFIAINEIESSAEKHLEEHYVRLPKWMSCVGHALHVSGKELRVVRMPGWYPYISVLIFFVMLGFAIAEYELAVLAMIAAIAVVALGLTTTARAIAAVDWEVIIMVAFSFTLASAMTKSGFSLVIGQALRTANVRGIGLLYLIATMATIMTNVITNKACVQVLIPIVVAAYREQGDDPFPAVMMTCALASMALSTPYGFATNLMVLGPGGYRPVDFIKFGVPLNVLATLLLPIITAVVYGMKW